MSLKWRIALGLAAIAALVSVFGATAAYLATEDQLRSNLDDSLQEKARDLSSPPAPPDGGPERSPTSPSSDTDSACPPGGFSEGVDVAQVVTVDDDVVACFDHGTTLPLDADAVRAARAARTPQLATIDLVGKDSRVSYRVVSIEKNSGSVLQLGRDLHEIEDILASLRIELLLLALAGTAAAALLGWVLASRIVAPITRLRDAAERIARTGDLDTELPEGGTGEVGSLATSFSTMVDGLADSRARQQRLIADASHELRTPLTSLQTNAELLERAERLSDAQRSQVTEGIRFEVGELTDLVSELVTLAADTTATTEPVEPIELAELVEGPIEAARLRTDRAITVALIEPAVVRGRARALTRAVSNLLDNAVKYGAGAIEVSVDQTTVSVHDHGAGIPESDLPRVFDRFYRADAARTETGSGLGLAIVAQVVERHGGSVFARNAADGGAIVGFTLPT